jgi:hypothetical protein
MLKIRKFEEDDILPLQSAIDADTFHPGEWSIEHFTGDSTPKEVQVIEDQKGPISFVRYTKTLRISCVWADGTDKSRNARAIIQGLRDAVEKARASGFTEVIIKTSYPELANFFVKVMKMKHSGDEYLLAL